MKQILIVGAGNIGFWYLDAIINSKIKLNIFIYDYKKNQIDKFKKKQKYKNKKIKYYNSLSRIPKKIDLCIISTLSKNRFNITNTIYSKFNVKNFIIEKIVEQNLDGLKNFLYLSKKINIFVSFPLRCSKFYKSLKSKRIKKFKLLVRSKVNDLASNGIHFLDLSSWLLSKKIKKIDTSKISSWLPAKRKGYKEFQGEIKILFKNGGVLILENNSFVSGKFEIFINKDNYTIKNNNQKIYINKNRIFKSNSISISKVMKLEISKILQSKKSNLPFFKDIYENHYLYIKSLLMNYNKKNKKNLKSLPIT